jgi:hypothetical protein
MKPSFQGLESRLMWRGMKRRNGDSGAKTRPDLVPFVPLATNLSASVQCFIEVPPPRL